MIIYVVENGDTVYDIATRYGLSAGQIITENELSAESINNLVVGSTLILPVESITHFVKEGDTLYKLSNYYNVPIDEILRVNPEIVNANNIRVGQRIIIPYDTNTNREIEVNGFVYPDVDMETLVKTLPNLTYLSIFSYDVNAMGDLKPINDQTIIAMAKSYGVKPMMVITNYDTSFNSDITNAIFTNPDVQANLINNVLNTIERLGYDGVVVDFEYIYPADREGYNEFITNISQILKQNNLLLFSALAPKISKDQVGTLYEAHDYSHHARYVDRVILMTYEWGYLFGDPQAVSPLPQIKQVLDYAITEIPSNKILLGFSNYGYDWKLPWVSGTPADILTNNGAYELAQSRGSFIQFDETSKAPYFRYTDTDGEHIVWFDDARSVFYRLKLVEEYNLAGISYWTLNNYYRQGFLVLNSLYNIKKLN